jgi:glutaredoxin
MPRFIDRRGPAGAMRRIVLFTQPGCLSCELMKVFLEARQISFQERDISTDTDARRTMMEKYDSSETPTLVVFSEHSEDIVIGFDPERLDHFLETTPSSDSVNES